jgi:hypothetical protein
MENNLEKELNKIHLRERQWSLCKERIDIFGKIEYCKEYKTIYCPMKCEYALKEIKK